MTAFSKNRRRLVQILHTTRFTSAEPAAQSFIGGDNYRVLVVCLSFLMVSSATRPRATFARMFSVVAVQLSRKCIYA